MVVSFSLFLFIFHLFFIMLGVWNSSFLFEWEFFSKSSFSIEISFIFDWISLFFASSVLFIACFVVLYSLYYMSADVFFSRFMFILIFFILSMMILVFSSNIISLMVGWDGLGVVSFCLVVYYSDSEALTSGLLTIMTNRVGDAFMLISIFFLGGIFETVESIYFFIFAAMTKSAQFPFSSWLPAAMSAPTPISSLVHSSTLVTAGVFILIRFNHLLMFFSSQLMFFSSMTMMGAGILALYEMDMKKIIAMSTLSQLGLMFFILSVGGEKFCFFHMNCHALFKSMMFLSCGGLIMFSEGNQDFRSKGLIQSPFFSCLLVFSSLSLMGIPFLSGFYSKDLILDLLFMESLKFVSYIIFLGGCFFTVLYSFRLMMSGLVFFSKNSYFVVMSNSFSFFSLSSIFVWAMVIGSFLGKFILVEEFIIVSFPVKTFGMMIILISLFLFLWKKMFELTKLTSMMFFLSLWTTSSISTFLFEFTSEQDQTWIEKMSFSLLPINFFTKLYFMEKDIFLIWIMPMLYLILAHSFF